VRTHDNQLDISPDLVRALIDRQFPQWRSLPVRRVAAAGTDNAIFRVGDRYTARFPLKATWPSSSAASGRFPPVAGPSPAAAEAGAARGPRLR